jgi:hypothetical protein
MNPIIAMICFASDRGRNVIESRNTASKLPRWLDTDTSINICEVILDLWIIKAKN